MRVGAISACKCCTTSLETSMPTPCLPPARASMLTSPPTGTKTLAACCSQASFWRQRSKCSSSACRESRGPLWWCCLSATLCSAACAILSCPEKCWAAPSSQHTNMLSIGCIKKWHRRCEMLVWSHLMCCIAHHVQPPACTHMPIFAHAPIFFLGCSRAPGALL